MRTITTADGVRLPMDIGTRVQCRWRDGQLYPVRVIERRPGDAKGNPEEYEYYVHYEQFNRRLDTWVTVAEMDAKSAEQDDPKKRGAGGHDEEHAEFDPNALREHEEVTKVRNILKVELGRHEMDTWYFSPFPPEYTTCKKLFFCEFTLNFFKRKEQLQRHLRKNEQYHPRGMRFTGAESRGKTTAFSGLTARKTRCSARTCVTSLSCFWITRRCTTTWTCFCSTCCARWTSAGTTSWGTSRRRSALRRGTTWRAS